MAHSVPQTLSGWGRYAPRSAAVFRPDRAGAVGRAVSEAPRLIARGLGRSYGDVAVGDAVLLTTDLDRLLDFDAATGELEIESGVSLDEIARLFLPRGWFLPITPGTRFVTVGGAIAADVHGKDHPVRGSVGHWLRSIALRLPTGERVRCSPELEPELFDATIGGLGLTGVIEQARMALEPVPSGWVNHRRWSTADLKQTLADLRAAPERFAVAWVDARRGLGGRGYVSVGQLATADEVRAASIADPLSVLAPRPRRLWVAPPGWALNGWLLAWFNARNWSAAAHQGLLDVWSFYYPLDAVADWNRLYGRRGLIQHQCVLPDERADEGVAALLAEVARDGSPCFLATLKRLGAEGRGMLSFPRPGLTLALDFKATRRALALLKRLDQISLEHGGRLYWVKDARASAATFAHMEGARLERFLAVRRRVDPEGRLQSDLSRRVGLTP